MSEARPLHDALQRLHAEFPDECLHEVRLEFQTGDRSDHPNIEGIERAWTNVTWAVQVGNERSSGATFDEAVAAIYEQRRLATLVKPASEKIAAVLSELPERGFTRNEVLFAAQQVLARNRGSR